MSHSWFPLWFRNVYSILNQTFFLEKLCTGSSVAAEAETSTSSNPTSHFEAQSGTTNSLANQETTWKPLLLIIPLRLGLSDINPIYFDHLKVKRCYSCRLQ